MINLKVNFNTHCERGNTLTHTRVLDYSPSHNLPHYLRVTNINNMALDFSGFFWFCLFCGKILHVQTRSTQVSHSICIIVRHGRVQTDLFLKKIIQKLILCFLQWIIYASTLKSLILNNPIRFFIKILTSLAPS